VVCYYISSLKLHTTMEFAKAQSSGSRLYDFETSKKKFADRNIFEFTINSSPFNSEDIIPF